MFCFGLSSHPSSQKKKEWKMKKIRILMVFNLLFCVSAHASFRHCVKTAESTVDSTPVNTANFLMKCYETQKGTATFGQFAKGIEIISRWTPVTASKFALVHISDFSGKGSYSKCMKIAAVLQYQTPVMADQVASQCAINF